MSSIAMLAYIMSVVNIPVSVVNTLLSLGPLITYVLEALYLGKKKMRAMQVVLTGVSFMGIVLIVQPEFLFPSAAYRPANLSYYVLPIISATCVSMAMIFLFEVRSQVTPNVSLFYNYYFQAIFSFVMFTAHPTPTHLPSLPWEVAWVVVMFVLFVAFTHFSQYFRYKAVYYASPSEIMPFGYVAVIAGIIIDYYIFHEPMNTIMVMGILLTSAGLFVQCFVS